MTREDTLNALRDADATLAQAALQVEVADLAHRAAYEAWQDAELALLRSEFPWLSSRTWQNAPRGGLRFSITKRPHEPWVCFCVWPLGVHGPSVRPLISYNSWVEALESAPATELWDCVPTFLLLARQDLPAQPARWPG